MKKITVLLLLLALLLGMTACGVPQEEVDALNEQIAKLQEDLQDARQETKDAEDTVKELKDQTESLENRLEDTQKQLTDTQKQLTDTENQLTAALAEVDELKNGPAAKLAEIRTAYESQDWKKVISLGNTLHSKYPGTDQDLEAVSLISFAQKRLDDEAAKAAAEAAKTMEDKVHGLIRITRLDCSSPNSAGGVGINLHFVNMHPEKTIKYLEVTVRPYNAVGDSQYCEIRNYSSYTCEATGPYAPGQGINAQTNWWWPNAWYNNTIKTVKLTGVSIEYMDGSYVNLKSDELPYAIW